MFPHSCLSVAVHQSSMKQMTRMTRRLISNVPKNLRAVSVYLWLTGMAKNATSEVPYEEITSCNRMGEILEKVERVYLLDKDWISFDATAVLMHISTLRII